MIQLKLKKLVEYYLWDIGKVVDYLAFKSRWKRLSRLTFNLGDVCIAAGTLLAALSRRK